ncbi:MAG: efflux transporter outer membrane subunit [Verrucomicrobiota bacterium]|jgi:NodT family efflux transporter outer membrane factor (OMF) lipoprotein
MNTHFSSVRLLPGVSLAALLLLGGCMVGPDYKPPQTKTPSAWAGVTNAPAASTRLTTNTADLARWWTQFQDPKLTELVQQAFRTNLDVQLAVSLLVQARAQRGIDAGGLWPDASVSGSASYGGQGPDNISQRSFGAGVRAAWTLDFFGGTRRQLEADDAKILAARENLHDAQVALAAEIGQDYIQLRGAQEQIAVALTNLDSERHTAKLTHEKLDAGFDTSLDVAQAEAEVASTEATIPGYETTVQQNIFALSVLLDRPPADLLEDLSKPAPIPLTPPEVPVGLPSELLRRRPDIREAEANLHAAAAQIGVATSDFYPQFTLNASVNYQNSIARDLLAGPSRVWSIGPSVNWPIFSGGSTVSNLRLQKAMTCSAYIQYQKTVLTALQGVESALVAFSREWDHRQSLTRAVQYNQQALAVSLLLYQQGLSDFLSVLDAERSLFGAQSALSSSKQSISTDLVTLYQALGGGWDENN